MQGLVSLSDTVFIVVVPPLLGMRTKALTGFFIERTYYCCTVAGRSVFFGLGVCCFFLYWPPSKCGYLFCFALFFFPPYVCVSRFGGGGGGVVVVGVLWCRSMLSCGEFSSAFFNRAKIKSAFLFVCLIVSTLAATSCLRRSAIVLLS